MNIDRMTFLQLLASLVGLPLSALSAARILRLDPSTGADPSPTSAIALPPEADLHLQEWLTSARIPLLKSDDPTERFFLRALNLKEPVTFAYYGGEHPGTIRQVHPVLLYRVQGYPAAYLTAYCLERQEIRVFRLDRIDLAVVDD